MADQTYYKAVGGITDGMTHYVDGAVFAGTESLDAHFADTGGKNADGDVLYEKASAKDYQEYRASLAVDFSGAPVGIVGFEPTGEAAFDEAQTDDNGEPLKADLSAPKNDDTEQIPLDHPEAERRAEGAAEQEAPKAATKSTTKAGSSE